MSEHDKAVGSLGKLFSYYNDRCTDAIYENPDIQRRVGVSVRFEKQKRIPKNYFLVPKTFEQIESYVTRLIQNRTLKVDRQQDILRLIAIKEAEI